ncbi:condensation domain-containing protein, partial [Mycobacterium sp. 3519A]|uniref:condensation domain-containing protein n=1 Tax=Mycobacterium sp. 3519A TaxID=2057184 RepID=UPI001F424F38
GADRYRAPTNTIEEIIAGIYAQVLDHDHISIDDSFFDLGGDSLSALRVLAAINKSLGARLSVRDFFDASTVAMVARRLDESAPGCEPLVTRERPEVIPLSFAQSRLWFLEQLESGSGAYNMPSAFHFDGPLNIEALGAALDDVIARHESLRTVFPDNNGVPYQCVLPARSGMWRHSDTEVVSVPKQNLADALMSMAAYRFDLSTDIPIRVQIYSVGPEQYVAGIVVHHIAFDGWSLVPMVRDLGVAYGARVRGCAPGWLPLPVQYVDYTLWQRAQFGDLDDVGSAIGGQLAYWRDALAGMAECVELPTDRPYPVVADQRGSTVVVEWSAELQRRVRELAARYNATSFMVVQAGLAVLLSRLSASSDVAVGFPVAGRDDPALDGLVGFFVNTLVLRVDLAGDPTVADVLAEVRRKGLAALEHRDVPFEVLVEQFNPSRSLTRHPLVQVALAWQNVPGGFGGGGVGLSLGDVQVTQVPVDTRSARMDLTFSLSECWSDVGEPDGIRGLVEFRTDVFDTSTVEGLVGRFERVLGVMVGDPQVRLSSVDVLGEGERARLDVWGNRAVLS